MHSIVAEKCCYTNHSGKETHKQSQQQQQQKKTIQWRGKSSEPVMIFDMNSQEKHPRGSSR